MGKKKKKTNSWQFQQDVKSILFILFKVDQFIIYRNNLQALLVSNCMS